MSDSKNLPIIIFGAGSIGERHIRNLWFLGYHKLFVFRQRNLPFRDIGDAEVTVIKTWKEVDEIHPYACIITSPTSLHLSQAIQSVKMGAHVLIEKPLSSDTNGFKELVQCVASKNKFAYVGYMMRFHPLLIRIKEIIRGQQYGHLISLQSKWGEYLPDWHPWEDYRTSYAAKQELGGGVALTLSHDIDIANWLIDSDVKKFFVQKNYKSTLELNVEAGADLLLKYQNGTTANIHLNFYELNKERFLKLVFEKVSIHLDFYESSLSIKALDNETKIVLRNYDRNDLFIEQTKYFFSKLNNFTVSESIQKIKESETIINICNSGI